MTEDSPPNPWVTEEEEEEPQQSFLDTLFRRIKQQKPGPWEVQKTKSKQKRRAQKRAPTQRAVTWQPRRSRIRVLKCLLALFLFVVFFITAVTSAFIRPDGLIILVPTVLILLDYVRQVWYASDAAMEAE